MCYLPLNIPIVAVSHKCMTLRGYQNLVAYWLKVYIFFSWIGCFLVNGFLKIGSLASLTYMLTLRSFMFSKCRFSTDRVKRINWCLWLFYCLQLGVSLVEVPEGLAGPHDLLSSADGAELRWACGWMSHLFQVTSIMFRCSGKSYSIQGLSKSYMCEYIFVKSEFVSKIQVK